MKSFSRVIVTGSLLLVLTLLAGCCCDPQKDDVTCGAGTHESTGPDGAIDCEADLKCGEGTHEQGTGTERECVSNEEN